MAAIATALAATLLVLLPPAFAHSAHLAKRAATVPNFAHDTAEMAKIFPNATIDVTTGGCLVVSDFAASAPATDPRFVKYTLTRAEYVFAPRKVGETSGWFRVATVHYEPDLSEQARRTACLIGRLWSAYKMHFGREIEFPFQADETNVYLLPQIPEDKKAAQIGGETRNNQIDVFGCGNAKRTPLEWVRTIAHEWGHLTIYAARGYTDPEAEAAGYLGERLFIKWLRETQAARPAAAPDDGTTAADLDLYYRRQIVPLMDRFQQGGPGSEQMDGENTEAMDYYIGSVLATDAALGSAITGIALRNTEAERPREFLISLRKYLYDKSDFTIQSPAWVPLREGDYRVTASASVPTSAAPTPTTLSVTTPTWSQFSEPGVLHVQRVQSARPSRPPRS